MKQKTSDINPLQIQLHTEEESVQFGWQLGSAIGSLTLTLYLNGDLGAGKTTISRGIVQSFGHKGAVKSPTYTLVEPYELEKKSIFHFDLYRMGTADELSFLGLDEYFSVPNSVRLVEWPEKGAGVLPSADLTLQLAYLDGLNAGRSIRITASSASGQQCLETLQALLRDSNK